jgi:hypothetical protein
MRGASPLALPDFRENAASRRFLYDGDRHGEGIGCGAERFELRTAILQDSTRELPKRNSRVTDRCAPDC